MYIMIMCTWTVIVDFIQCFDACSLGLLQQSLGVLAWIWSKLRKVGQVNQDPVEAGGRRDCNNPAIW